VACVTCHIRQPQRYEVCSAKHPSLFIPSQSKLVFAGTCRQTGQRHAYSSTVRPNYHVTLRLVQVFWVSAVASSSVHFSSQHTHLHPAAFHTAWVLALIGLLFFIKAQLLHQTLLQRLRCRKTLLAGIALLCMGVGAAGSVQIILMGHSHVQALRATVHGFTQPIGTVVGSSTWPLLRPDLLPADHKALHVSSQTSWQSAEHQRLFPAEERYASVAHVVLALLCTVSASMSAHGAAGYVLHHSASSKARASTWAFFQPFRGGATFIAVQFLGWTLFTVEVLGLLHAALAVARGFVIPRYDWLLAVGMVCVPVLLAASALSFQERKKRDVKPQKNQCTRSGQPEVPFRER
jgi:hypothetical protein